MIRISNGCIPANHVCHSSNFSLFHFQVIKHPLIGWIGSGFNHIEFGGVHVLDIPMKQPVLYGISIDLFYFPFIFPYDTSS